MGDYSLAFAQDMTKDLSFHTSLPLGLCANSDANGMPNLSMNSECWGEKSLCKLAVSQRLRGMQWGGLRTMCRLEAVCFGGL